MTPVADIHIAETTIRLLDEAVRKINSPAFVPDDPVQFPRRYTRLQDVEIVALLTATIAWGRRDMILRNAGRMLARLGQSPYEYVMRGDFGEWGKGNVHRTFFECDVRHYLCGLGSIYRQCDSLNDYFRAHGAAHAWDVAALLRERLTLANGTENAKCLPSDHAHSALKRLNLALRWMVRNDGIVDLGVWDFITPAELYIPLDVHSARTARRLGLLRRNATDRKAAEELTAVLRRLCPGDPVRYDFALFGLGVNEAAGKCPTA